MDNQKTVFVFLYGAVLAITLGIALVLCMQYHYFKREALELAQVKEAYYQHVEMLKRSLNASMLSDEEEDQDTDVEKKKLNEQGQSSFSVSATNVEPKVQFELISDDEEHVLKAIKTDLRPKIQSTVKRKKRTKSRRAIAQVHRSSMRYAPARDFVFSWPVDIECFWLSSLFGPRKRPNGQVEFHHAIDMAAIKGTPVKAAASGKVVLAQSHSGFGNCIMIEHNNRYKTRYAHLHRIGVHVGQTVQQGQVIGSVGDTGLVIKSGRDASHLHFEIHQDGRRVNPLAFLFS